MADRYLFDTVACSRLRRRDPQLLRKIESFLPGATVYTSVITVGEMELGIWRATEEQRQHLQISTRQMLGYFGGILDVSREVAKTYGRIVAQVPRGLLIGDNDFWIAAIALTHDLVLITKDSDFDRVPGLRKEGWPA